MIEGRLPFPPPHSPAESDLETALADRSTPPPSPRQGHASPGLRAIVAKCLEPDPLARYASAAELLEDLDREQACLPLQHATEGWLSRVGKLASRYPRLFSATSVAAACLTVLVIVLAAGWTWRQRSLTLEAEVRLAKFADRSQEQVLQLLTASPDQLPEVLADLPMVGSDFQLGSESLAASAWLGRLPEAAREDARRTIFRSCLTAAALAIEHGRDLDQ